MVSERSWQLCTAAGCELVIGGFPPFSYDATGGGGISALEDEPEEGGATTRLDFPPHQLTIPPLDSARGRFLGLPLPPGLSIQIRPDRLAGQLNLNSGELTLDFRSRFQFTLGRAEAPLYQASDLVVETQLTTGTVHGQRQTRSGRPLGPDGSATLVGMACIEPCRDPWLNWFLGLPDQALAVMHLTLQEIECAN